MHGNECLLQCNWLSGELYVICVVTGLMGRTNLKMRCNGQFISSVVLDSRGACLDGISVVTGMIAGVLLVLFFICITIQQVEQR